ncbi:MAG: MMPL family transporter [Pirellulales bacterium]
MFERLGAAVARHGWLIIVAWVIVAAALKYCAPRWDDVTHDGDLAYLPAALPSVEGAQLLARSFPENQARSEIGVIVERRDGRLTAADLRWSDALAVKLREGAADLPVLDVWNRNTEIVGDKLLSKATRQGQAALTVVQLKNEFMAIGNLPLVDALHRLVDEARREAPPGLNVQITGSAAAGADMLHSAAESIRNTEWATIGLVVLILLLVYRAPLLVLIPLVTIGLALTISLDLLALLTQVSHLQGFSWWHFKVFTTTRIFIVVILFGAGTDFCLFLIARFKEELGRGLAPRAAGAEAVGRVGMALLGSALTTIVGLGTMYFADFGKFRNSGPAIALCLAVTLVACLTLAPALLLALGRWVFWPWSLSRPSAAMGDESSSGGQFAGFWQWAADVIVRRPGVILVASIALLTPLALQGLNVRLTYDLLNELDPARPSVRGAAVARRHFPAGEMSPVTVLAFKPDANFESKTMEREIARLTKRLYSVDGVDSVRSLAEPTGDPPGYFQPFSSSGLKKLAAREHKTTEARFVTKVPELAGQVARFDVVFDAAPFSPAAVAMLDRLDQYLARLADDPRSAWHGASFVFAGTTSGIRDLAAVTSSDQVLIQRLVLFAVLAVLILILRTPWICLYLILSVLFSYFATIGATQWFFTWWYGDSFQGLDWKVPIFLFVILIAVGEDYNIYLVTRVLEEQRRYGVRDGLRRAVARTGGIITSCGVIMAGTFISMATGTLRGMQELGFALSLGVILDTCVVRPVLVPAFLALVQREPVAHPSDDAEEATAATDEAQESWATRAG